MLIDLGKTELPVGVCQTPWQTICSRRALRTTFYFLSVHKSWKVSSLLDIETIKKALFTTTFLKHF